MRQENHSPGNGKPQHGCSNYFCPLVNAPLASSHSFSAAYALQGHEALKTIPASLSKGEVHLGQVASSLQG